MQVQYPSKGIHVSIFSQVIAALQDLFKPVAQTKAIQAEAAILEAVKCTKSIGLSEAIVGAMLADCFGYSWMDTRSLLQALESRGEVRLKPLPNNIFWVS